MSHRDAETQRAFLKYVQKSKEIKKYVCNNAAVSDFAEPFQVYGHSKIFAVPSLLIDDI